jgi:tetratricopeptide (TPR) repeat protein
LSLQVQLTRLEDAGLVQIAAAEPEPAYLFRHGLIQDAAYSTLLRGQRRAWHRAAADVLESLCRTEADTIVVAPILARHCSLADDHPRALRYLIIAGDAAFGHYANEEAAEFYRQALEIIQAQVLPYQPAQGQHVSSRYGRALELTSRFEAALAHYRHMETIARRQGDLALELAAVMARATIHSTANMAQDLPQAARLLAQASQLAHTLGDAAAEANINWTLMLSNVMAGGDPEQSARFGRQALDTARASGQLNLVALVLTDLWFGRANHSEWDLARAELLEAGQIAGGLGNLTVAAEGLQRLAMTDMITGHYDRSLAEMQQATEMAEALNSNDMRALTRMSAGLIYFDRGDCASASAFAEEAVRLGELTNNITVLIGTRADLGWTYVYLGDIDRGLALAQKAEDYGNRFGLIGGWAGATVARIALLLGDLATARSQIAKYPDYRDPMRRVGFVPMMWAGLGLAATELALRSGDLSRALAAAEELDGHIQRTGVIYIRPECQLVQARVLVEMKRVDEAAAVLASARAEAEALTARRLLWPILVAQADLVAAQEPTAARDLRAQAQTIVHYIAEHAPTPALRQSFLARADVRALLTLAA